MNISAIRGARYLLPNEQALHDRLVQIASTISSQFLFKHITIPTIEYSELFSLSLGSTSEVVNKELYSFTDRSDRSISLRPEGTAGVMRLYLQGLRKENAPHKYFYEGSMYRYERPQKGRSREFHQFGVEVIGDGSENADVESLHLASEILKAFSFVLANDGDQDSCKTRSVQLKINCLGDEQSRIDYRSALEKFLQPHFDQLSEDSKMRFQRGSVLRIMDSKDKQDQQILQLAPLLKNYISSQSGKRFHRVLKRLELLEIPYSVDDKLVRGLDYYDESVFEFVDKSEQKAQNAVLAGGRYNRLCQLLGGPSTPSVGWAMGTDRIRSILGDDAKGAELNGTESPLISVVIVRPKSWDILEETQTNKDSEQLETERIAIKIANELRSHNYRILLNHDESMTNQLRLAKKLESVLAVIVGPEELRSGNIQIKDMRSGVQERSQINELVPKIKSIL